MYAELMQKTCKKCARSKHILEFYKDKRYADRRFPWCKSCKKEHARNNPQLATNWSAKNEQASRAIKQRYVDNNPCKVKEAKRSWSKANPKKELAKTRKYQSDKLKRTPKWLTKEEIKNIESFYVNCPAEHEVDHILPLRGKNVSGLHVLSNLQYLPIKTNRKKSNKY